MSGTSGDGIDAVLAEVAGSGRQLRARVLTHVHRPFSPAMRQRILHLCLHGTVSEICELNFVLGEQFARAALAVIRRAKRQPREIAAIGSHGQTIHHLPNARTPSTLQIGEPAVIAERTGITTVADFRVRDMAAGGQGAPLVPYADWALFTDETRPRIVQNIGGIGNLTFLPPSAGLNDVIAFDTGPGNMMMDRVVQRITNGKKSYDDGGQMARSSDWSAPLLEALLAHPYLHRRPPKSTGREEFGVAYADLIYDRATSAGVAPREILATLTRFNAHSIARAYRRFLPALPDEVILCGGGARNRTLVQLLKDQIGPQRVLLMDKLGISSEAKEAVSFALLARETIRGLPGNVPAATGAERPAVLGKVVPGKR